MPLSTPEQRRTHKLCDQERLNRTQQMLQAGRVHILSGPKGKLFETIRGGMVVQLQDGSEITPCCHLQALELLGQHGQPTHASECPRKGKVHQLTPPQTKDAGPLSNNTPSSFSGVKLCRTS